MLSLAILAAYWLNHRGGITHHFTGLEGKDKEFAIWAFGDEYWYMNTIQLMKAWNERHGDDYKLSPDSEISKDAPKMIALWNSTKL